MSNGSSAYNVTTLDGVTPGEYSLSQFFLVQEYGSSMKTFSFMNALGALLGTLLMGYVWSETVTYYRICRNDSRWNKILVGVLSATMTACQTLGAINSLQITDHWNDYGNMIRTDELFRYTQLTLIAVVIGPITFAFFGLRVWALQGRSVLVTAIFAATLTAQIVLGIVLSVYGMQVPKFDAKTGLTISKLLELQEWSKRDFKLYKIWSIFTVINVIGVTLAILATIWVHRTTDRTLNRMLLRLAISLLECMILPIAETLIFTVTMIASNGLGGLTRIFGNIASPFFAFAVIHSLLDRGPMQQRLKQIGLSSTMDTSRDIESIPMPELQAVKVEIGDQLSPSDGDDENFWCKDVSTNQASFMDVASNRSSRALRSSPDSLDLTRRRIRQFHATWDNPVANQVHYGNRNAWGFSLGSTEERA